MAERRMFSKKIVESDAFLSLPVAAQLLYFHLCLHADDDGFVNNPIQVARSLKLRRNNLDTLSKHRFILCFANDVIVIKHWRINNQMRKDRYSATQYHQEMASLRVKPNGAYTEIGNHDGNQMATDLATTMATNWQPNGNQRLPQYSRGEESRVEERGDGNQTVAKTPTATAPRDPNLKVPRGSYGNILLSDYEVQQLRKQRPADWEDKLQKVDTWLQQNPSRHIRDHFDTIIRWAEEDDKDTRRNLSVMDTSVHFTLERHDQSSYDTHYVDLFAEEG